ncbi:MAG: hypothetical protein V1740_04360 [Candidatus Woesearchaeota archaeon]
MTAHKYPNKKKRKGYWKVYDRARIKDFRKVWDFALEIVQEQGCPFVKKDNRGRKPKFYRDYYPALSVILLLKNGRKIFILYLILGIIFSIFGGILALMGMGEVLDIWISASSL